MRTLNPKRLSTFLRSRDSGLKTLLDRGDELLRLTEEVRGHLPLPLSLHCRVGGVRDGRLTLVADTPAWAARLRFHGPGLIQKLSPAPERALNQVRVIISPPGQEPAPPRRRPRLSAASARLLGETASGMDDPQLSAALLRLARRTGPST